MTSPPLTGFVIQCGKSVSSCGRQSTIGGDFTMSLVSLLYVNGSVQLIWEEPHRIPRSCAHSAVYPHHKQISCTVELPTCRLCNLDLCFSATGYDYMLNF